MKTHLNTLFVTTQGAYLRKDGETVDVRVEKKSRLRVPLHNLDGIVGFGRVSMSPALMGSCAEAGVTISFLTLHGRFLASVSGFTPGNVLLRRQQYRTSDDPAKAVEVAKAIVAGKLGNCRTVLRRAARDTGAGERQDALNKAADKLTASLEEALLSRDRPGRPGMALDLMEEFRPFLADRLVLSLINRQQIKAGDFTIRESGAVQMNDSSRKAMLVA